MNRYGDGSQSVPQLTKFVPPQAIQKPYNPQFQSSYEAHYSPSREKSKTIETLKLAQPYRPDMKVMFQGHNSIAGGLSGVEGVGNLGSTFKTNYQINYNEVYEL